MRLKLGHNVWLKLPNSINLTFGLKKEPNCFYRFFIKKSDHLKTENRLSLGLSAGKQSKTCDQINTENIYHIQNQLSSTAMPVPTPNPIETCGESLGEEQLREGQR
ncbi:hypothetical protein AMECASPLE_030777 [Ameca splendens]|uniref:Uncharacterized protein n=1 Tax=Ameca splendens TaxID=208324 RepID=A0ABV0ZEX3_9TELE